MPPRPHYPTRPLTPREVKQIRTDLGLSQMDLAHHLGLQTASLISHWEAGRRFCDGPAAQLLRLYHRSQGKAMQWAYLTPPPSV